MTYEFWIVTTGRGILPAGKKVGRITAASAEDAKEQLRSSGQVGETGPDYFDYIPVETGLNGREKS